MKKDCAGAMFLNFSLTGVINGYSVRPIGCF